MCRCCCGPRRTAAEIPPLTLLAGAAVARAVALLGVSPRLKWPNDVQLVDAAGRRRKLAGVLTEMVSAGERVEHVVVGIGINVNATAFPAELADRATSLRRRPDSQSIARGCSPACWTRSSRCTTSSNGAGRRRRSRRSRNSRRFRDRCRVDDRLEGVALGVDPDGALRLRDDAGQIHRVISGEVQP